MKILNSTELMVTLLVTIISFFIFFICLFRFLNLVSLLFPIQTKRRKVSQHHDQSYVNNFHDTFNLATGTLISQLTTIANNIYIYIYVWAEVCNKHTAMRYEKLLKLISINNLCDIFGIYPLPSYFNFLICLFVCACVCACFIYIYLFIFLFCVCVR